ncbi:hypothetical protein SKAU_G00250540 [Synaphobranchus kaupii]|uniref:Uncharacterized protein n=1 Tax=Synaphobranchus kaupii TaxID=118154 RepID=A0A9Q1IPR5_SYNKA|nr:hypothetical protein SKAU_G00250540 [Synaphobranchus kaupii]
MASTPLRSATGQHPEAAGCGTTEKTDVALKAPFSRAVKCTWRSRLRQRRSGPTGSATPRTDLGETSSPAPCWIITTNTSVSERREEEHDKNKTCLKPIVRNETT